MRTLQTRNPTRASFGGVRALVCLVGIGATASSALAGASSVPVFNFSSFGTGEIAQLRLNGVAEQTPGFNRLSVTPNVANSKGSAWYQNEVNILNGFQTQFTFRSADRSGRGADGFAFVLHTDPRGTTAIGGEGGAMGYARNTKLPTDNAGMTRTLAIEFDVWNNNLNGVGDVADWNDFNSDNHVSVQASSGTGEILPDESASLGHTNLNPATLDLNDGATHTAVITYDTSVLQIFIDGNSVLSVNNPDIAGILGLNSGNLDAFVGFTAGTGGSFDVERHEILSWSLSSTVPAPASASLIALSGVLATRRRRPRV